MALSLLQIRVPHLIATREFSFFSVSRSAPELLDPMPTDLEPGPVPPEHILDAFPGELPPSERLWGVGMEMKAKKTLETESLLRRGGRDPSTPGFCTSEPWVLLALSAIQQ